MKKFSNHYCLYCATIKYYTRGKKKKKVQVMTGYLLNTLLFQTLDNKENCKIHDTVSYQLGAGDDSELHKLVKQD